LKFLSPVHYALLLDAGTAAARAESVLNASAYLAFYFPHPDEVRSETPGSSGLRFIVKSFFDATATDQPLFAPIIRLDRALADARIFQTSRLRPIRKLCGELALKGPSVVRNRKYTTFDEVRVIERLAGQLALAIQDALLHTVAMLSKPYRRLD